MDTKLIDILINWMPMILLIGAWFYIMRRYSSGRYSKYQQECLDLAKRQAEAVERIAAALEKRA
jgi:ATP-dependent Zn protease